MDKMTQTELSQLKDEIELFKGSRIWQGILTYMQSMYASVAEDALTSDEIAKVKWCGGVAHAVKMISNFDENIPLFKSAKESE